MTPEEWQRIKQVMGDALDQPDTKARLEFLSAACDGDRALQSEIEAMLAGANDRLDIAADRLAGVPVDTGDAAAIGERLGDYELVRELGRGGMGTIYLARRADEEFEKKVAIKVLKRGTDTDEVLRRFRAERQILAQLEHPNIARLIDAGTRPDGLPYFVMEYVDGIPITDFCDSTALNVPERIELFLKVCGAIHFAHQNLVVHRDLKPGNILITATGEPKLLDFGIAKLLSPENDFRQTTIQSQQRFTPAYASPEQIRGDPVTTAADVYSLGALLYHLLAGVPPHRFESPQPSPTEIFRVIVEEDPVRPSVAACNRKSVRAGLAYEIRKSLSGDLDNILSKVLQKRPTDRYPSVTAFSDDLRRYLDGRPVRARPATLGYRAAKFVSRNRLAVAAGILLFVTLLGGIVTTARQAAIAQRRFKDVRKLANSVLFDYHDSIASLPGSTAVRERLVKDALEYLDNLSREGGNDPGLLRELATAYQRVGQIQGNAHYSNLGDTTGALKSYRASLALREKLRAARPDDAEILHEVADSYEGLGDILQTRGELRAAVEQYEHALSLREQLFRAHPANLRYARALAELCTKVGDVRGGEDFPNLGDIPGALAAYRRAQEILEPLSTAHPDNLDLKSDLAEPLMHSSLLALSIGDAAGGLRDAQRAVELMQEVAGADPTDQDARSSLSAAKSYLGEALTDNDRLTEAVQQSRTILTEDEQLLAADPKNSAFRWSLIVSHNVLGRNLLSAGEKSEAIEHHRIALEMVEKVIALDPESEDNKSDLAYTLQVLGRAQSANGEHATALANLRQALALREAAVAAEPANARARENVTQIYEDIGAALARSNDPAGALEAFAKAIPLAEEHSRQSPIHARRKVRLARLHLGAGRIHLELARSSENRENSKTQAREHLRRSLVLWQELQARNALIPANTRKLRETEAALAECDAL